MFLVSCIRRRSLHCLLVSFVMDWFWPNCGKVFAEWFCVVASKHTAFASRSSAHQSHERWDMPLVERDGGGQPTQWSLLHRPRTSHYTLYSYCRNVLDLQMSWGRFFLHARLIRFCSTLWRSSAFGLYGKNIDTEASPHTSSNLYNH